MTLGDGNMVIQKSAINPSIRFNHSSKQREYSRHKIALLQQIFPYDLTRGYSEVEVENNKQNGKRYKICRFASRVSPKLKTVYKAFYQNGKKVVTKQGLKMLTHHGLAIWYMDDGCWNKGNRTVMISTYTTLEQNQLIVDYFKEKWGIEWRIGKHYDKYFLIRGEKSDDIKKFMKMISPYVIPQMRYKLVTQAVAPRNGDDIVRHFQ